MKYNSTLNALILFRYGMHFSISLYSLLCLLLSPLITGCSEKTDKDIGKSNTYDIQISETKYDEIKATLSNYITKQRMTEDEQREFIYSLCDTTNRIYHPVFFRYKSKVEEYSVEGLFCIGADGSLDYQDWGSVFATLYFSSDSITFSIEHNTFRPIAEGLPDTLKALDCIELSYNSPNIPNPRKITLDSIRDLPFAFIDIDFDGKKDLLLANPGNGQKSISTYSAYSLPTLNEINPFHGYTWNRLDEWTEFDYDTQTVISLLWGGYDGSEKWYFRYEGDRLKPYLKEEYTRWFEILKSSTSIPYTL